jgi:hypothetical protein
MKPELRYIELKTGHTDNGPAWIGLAEFSKSRQTVYFNGQAFRNIGGAGIGGNFVDIESGDEYWISGIKKDGADRHWAGTGKIKIDRNVVELYLSIVKSKKLNFSRFELTDILPTDKQKFNDLENQKIN